MIHIRDHRWFKKQGFIQTGIKKDWIKTSDGYLDEYFFQLISPVARWPQAAEISIPRDLRIEADIPEIMSLCLNNSILSAEDEVFKSFPTVW